MVLLFKEINSVYVWPQPFSPLKIIDLVVEISSKYLGYK